VQPVRNPNSWSCLPAAIASVMEWSLEDLITQIGHDGSEITHAGLPDPLCRRGFHPQEIIKVLIQYEMAVTRIELHPTAVPQMNAGEKQFDTGGWDWYLENLLTSYGIIDCRTSVGTGHAMAYHGGYHDSNKHWCANIYDPGNGNEYKIRHTGVLEDFFRHDRYPVALWRIDYRE
jgi:hypothetical protein